jgi:hypothetical protein
LYGQAGVWELGLNTSGSYNMNNRTETFSGSAAPDNQQLINLGFTVFAKYYVLNGFHLGAYFDYSTGIHYDNTGAFQAATHTLLLTVTPGYAIRISPNFLIDLSLKAGGAINFYWFPSWNTLFDAALGGEIMCLFPVFEHVVIGCGYTFLYYLTPLQSITVYSSSLGYSHGTMQGNVIANIVKFQISFYF